MPPKALPAPKSRPKNAQATTSSLSVHLNQENAGSKTLKRVRQSDSDVVISENGPSEERAEPYVSKRKSASTPLIAEYLISAKTFVGIQVVHRDSLSTIEGFWSYRKYFEESERKVAQVAQERGIEPELKSSIATIHSKSMKKDDYVERDVVRAEDWFDVESVVHHLAKSLSKGIRVDLEIKYSYKHVNESLDEDNEVDLSEEDTPAPTKRPRKVFGKLIDF